MPSQDFGKYQLVKKLATGGMAEVWLARQSGIEGFNRHVVIKCILPHLAEDPEFVQMFLNEAKIAARFNHPNIAQIYDLGETGGQYYIAMEFIHGEDLGRLMRRAWSTGQWVARATALRIVADACAGLYYAHSRADDQGRPLKVVHRDISPQNILISFDGSVKLVDFGIAKAGGQASVTRSGAIKGKIAYMAPEQAGGKPLDGRADIFALGLVLYELLTGVRPIKRDSEIATLQAALECSIEPPSRAAEVPAELDGVVMKALAKNAEDRYRDARQFQMALEQQLVQEGTVATSVQVSELMELLFADRLAEEAKLGAPAPASESSVSNPIAPLVTPRSPARPLPELGDDDGEDDATLAPDPDQAPPGDGADGNRPQPRPDSPRRRGAGPSPVSRDRAGGPAPALLKQGELATPLAPKRRTTVSVKKRTASSGGMPDAPSRKARPSAPNGEPRKVATSGAARDTNGASSGRGASLGKAVIKVAFVAALAAAALLFKEPLVRAIRTPAAPPGGGIPVLLSVASNPQTRVRVIPRSGVGGREVLDLGESPMDQVHGAFAGDLVELSNPERGLFYQQTLAAKAPNERVKIQKTFLEGTLTIRTRPALQNATLWKNNQLLGSVGVSVNVFEGLQKLEIRADSLAQPVEFELMLGPGQKLEREVPVPGGTN